MLKTRLWIAAAAATSVMTLVGCASGPNQNLGTGIGALGGAAVGHAIGGNTGSTLGGAAIGGVIGNQVGRSVDERNYYEQQQQQRYPRGSGYYPYNGPRY
ncbi:glycine zipper domain-containing protein [Variovorax sp. 38R]|uniref:glycine zipper domain-containing protein n=1 Tax=Variovorax sp. 38R TaxID=2774875 RepID=UPI001CE15CA3|nr:glycine zipper domain-containing protein [Variovorax sp. 38R]